MTRSSRRIRIVALAVLLATGALALVVALAGRTPRDGRQDEISARYRAARAGCAAQSGHPKAVCDAEARAGDRNDRAALEASYDPSARASHHAQAVAADSQRAVAQARCAGGQRAQQGACETQADATLVTARADARTELMRAEAAARAADEATKAQAGDEQRAASQQAARLQCEGYATGRLRAKCLAQNKARFARN